MLKLCSLFLGILFLLLPTQIFASEKIWQIQSIDTMKYSRDESRSPITKKLIPIQVKAIADTGANYIAIDTPYDDEFIPVMKLWVEEARKYNLGIWFRGNFSGWEGWFDYPRLTSTDEHIQKTYRFITQNPDLFKDGDIFTPAPEPEAGIMGDPRRTGKVAEFNEFILDSTNNCKMAFKKINRDVNCGIWSFNTDVARETVYKDTIQRLGGILAIDHYDKTPEHLIEVAKSLSNMFDAKVMLGEFGAPIPDINGKMSEKEQADYIDKVGQLVFENKDIIEGLNYWVIAGGSTTLLNDDNKPHQAIQSLKLYFDPAIVTGKVENTLGEPLENIDAKIFGVNLKTKTDKNGEYKFVVPAKYVELEVGSNVYKNSKRQFIATNGANLQPDFILEPYQLTFDYKLKIFWQKLVLKVFGKK